MNIWEQVGQVKRNMDQMKRNMGTIEKTHGQALSSVSRDAANKRQEELDDLMDQTSTCMKSVRRGLALLLLSGPGGLIGKPTTGERTAQADGRGGEEA